jgi:hypothetical protein
MYCNETIEMNDKTSGKWLPYNMDGTQHDCRNQKQIQGPRKVEINNNNKQADVTPEAKAWVKEIMEGPKIKELEARVKRLESFLYLAGTNKQ